MSHCATSESCLQLLQDLKACLAEPDLLRAQALASDLHAVLQADAISAAGGREVLGALNGLASSVQDLRSQCLHGLREQTRKQQVCNAYTGTSRAQH